MKVSRFKVAVLVLLAVTVIYPVALHLDIQRYEARKQAELESHPDVAPWIDFNPYGTTFTGALLIFIAATLVICWTWVCVVVVKTHRKKLRSAILMVLLFIVVLSFTPRAYAGYYEKTIDVLAVQDEEFRFLYPQVGRET